MIVSSTFSGDDNELLKDVQHDAYSKNVGLIFSAAKNALIQADKILNTNLLIAEKLSLTFSFDHRVLQNAHDMFAAAYRHECQSKDNTYVLPEDERLSIYLSNWNAWYVEQINLVISKNPQFVRAVVESVLFSNFILGQLAEEEACRTLINFYRIDKWGNRDHYAKIYASLRE